jgi:DNA-binding PadR family transcriptional regulator
MVTSEFGEATAVRGGKRKRYYTATPTGRQALTLMKEQRMTLWNAIPQPQFRIA